MPETNPLVTRRSVIRYDGGARTGVDDALAVEGPLEVRIGGQTVSVTLRSPGHDAELALGFLASEGLIAGRKDVRAIELAPASCSDQADAVNVTLADGVTVDWARLERHFAATAACGLCGRAHLESLRAGLRPLPAGPRIDPGALMALPERLRATQAAFGATGGLHAAALCDAALKPLALREDVGRHNAVDKIAGWLLEQERYPAREGALWVSGRAGAEIVLKAARAGIPVLAAVGAPSSLAVDLAEAAAMTLVGFLREGRMNVYCRAERLAAS